MTTSSLTTRWIPLFPLGTTLFPGGVIALKIFEARYLDMMKRCLREDTPFGVISILDNKPIESDVDAIANFSNIGTLAKLEKFDPIQPALYMTQSYGTQRFKVLNIKQEPDGLWMGQVELMDADPEMPLAIRLDLISEIIEDDGLRNIVIH